MRYKCVVSYVGAGYEGWQSQTKGTSIQEKIEDVLLEVSGEKINITASGRTDSGVNARAQVFMFDSDMERMNARKWMGALNGMLPKDIHIMDCREVSPLFHARYNVRYKKYTYRINDGPYDVFTKDTMCQCPVKLDDTAMAKAADYFKGTHDFTAFNSSSLTEYPDQVRTIYDVQLKREGNLISITFTGKGFLRYMVRFMSGALINVGKHKTAIEHVKEMLDSKDRNIPRNNAPACGLTLEEVNYFELLALSSHVQIREYLYGDALPEGKTLEEIEEGVRNKQNPRYYAFAMRNSQEIIGYLKIDQKTAGLWLYHLADEIYVNEIAESLSKELKKRNIESGYVRFLNGSFLQN